MPQIGRVAAAALAGAIASAGAAQDAVQWRVEDGGNGHWYRADVRNLGWLSARAFSESRGAHLVTITSIQENDWLVATLPARPCSTSGGHWHTGGYQEPSDPEPAGFRWVTGEPFEFTNWSNGSPSNSTDFCPEGEDVIALFGASGACGSSAYSGRWNDLPACGDDWGPGFVIEWSADCNGDGIVDYGQILDGTFADENGDGVPDLCEAVQWRVEDGGNGHWYAAVGASGSSWISSEAAAAARGGHLATITSESENGFVGDIVTDDETGSGWWIGGRWNADEENWAWITGEEWAFESWGSSKLGCNNQPDGRDAVDIYCIDINGDARWSDDYLDWPNAFGYVIEWSADCNGDGIVDYGQILDGTFADLNRNGVPDCCEPPCEGDLNLDNRVDSADLGLLIAAWNTDGSIVAGSDLNGDGIVNAADLGLQIGNWGECSGCN